MPSCATGGGLSGLSGWCGPVAARRWPECKTMPPFMLQLRSRVPRLEAGLLQRTANAR